MKTVRVVCLAVGVVLPLWARKVAPENFQYVVSKTAAMVSDKTARDLASQHKLNILNVTWEDVGRYKNSSVGPNISDMTIQVKPEGGAATCMPVIRFPNFSDKTGDIASDKFFLQVGNEKGESLKKVSLKEYLQNLRKYMSFPESWAGSKTSLWHKRDEHVLVSAQACFLPIPKSGKATFNPVLFNYQSYAGNPAVLTILATREGTSVTIIDNQRDGFSSGGVWGQRLFFNENGKRTSLTGERMSDFVQSAEGQDIIKNGSAQAKAGLNMVMLIQVPLKQKSRSRSYGGIVYEEMEMAAPMVKCMKKKESTVENAVIGHGDVEGPFTEIDNLSIERDPSFPIRVTVQFYKATDNGVVNPEDMQEIADQIARVYDEADYVGSLVTGGNTGRPTEYIGDKNEPKGWWYDFWHRQEADKPQSFGW